MKTRKTMMTPPENEELVEIHPKHLKLIQFHLSQYFDLLCAIAEVGDDNKQAINEIGSLDFVIDTILGTYCNDTA